MQAAALDGSKMPEGRKMLDADNTTIIWMEQNTADKVPEVYKLYRNRGCISWQREKLYQFRVEREYNALLFLGDTGISCSTPVFWSFGEHSDHGRYEILGMKMIPHATDLETLALTKRTDEVDYEVVHRLLKTMHEAGFYHGALHHRNILSSADTNGTTGYHIIDTPQAIRFPESIVGSRMAWIDMRQFSIHTASHLGSDRCRELLLVYGMSERQADKMLVDLRKGNKAKLTRNLLRFEFGIRSRLTFPRVKPRSFR